MTDIKCLNESCNQRLPLYQTGYDSKQGPTHYCRVCGWGFWTHIVKPTADEIKKAKQVNPAIKEEQLIRIVLKPVPPTTAWGSNVERIMAEQLGKRGPWWLPKALHKIWLEKYYQIYPSQRPKEKEE